MGGPALSRRRIAALLAAALIVAVVTWWIGPGPSSWEDQVDHDPFAAFDDPHLADPALATRMMAHVRGRLAGATTTDAELTSVAGRRVWVCAFRPGDACGTGDGPDLGAALDQASTGLADHVDGSVAPDVPFVVDLALGTRPLGWPREKRPHDAGLVGLEVGGAVVLPREVLSRGLFRAEDDDDRPEWDERALTALLVSRGADPAVGMSGSWLWTTTWAEPTPGGTPVRMVRLHPFTVPALTPDHLLHVAREAAEHLARTVRPNGSIRYVYDPVANEVRAGENLLRHAGTTYSLVQAWERTGAPAWRDAAVRAIRYVLSHSARDVRHGPFGGGEGMYVVEGSDIKLGGAGLALVMLSTWETATGDRTWHDDAARYATFLLSQQNEDGEFVSFPSRTPGGTPRDEASAYYPGEATLGLVLFHAHDPDGPWLDAARRGADWLIDVRDRGKSVSKLANDHWLMIALSHLYAKTKDERYLDHTLRLADAVAYQARRHVGHDAFHPDYRGGYYEPPRGTPAATRAEGLVAVLDACHLASRPCPSVKELLLATLGHVLQGQYRADLVGWAADPSAVAGAFPGGILDPLVRNDYTQHALSAVLGTERLLRREDGERVPGGPGWTGTRAP